MTSRSFLPEEARPPVSQQLIRDAWAVALLLESRQTCKEAMLTRPGQEKEEGNAHTAPGTAR